MQEVMLKILTVFAFVIAHIAGFAQVHFVEVSTEKGMDYQYPGNDFQMAGGGVMVIDVNNDGWEDLFQAGGVFDSKLWINKGGTFEDGTAAFGLDVLSGYFIQGTVAADYDNDGFRDFIVANYGTGMSRGDKHAPVIMHNVKGKYFELENLEKVILPGNYSSACWGDVNKDGFVDVYLTNYIASMGGIQDSNGVDIGYDPECFENKFLLNLGGNGFRECAAEFGIADGGCGLSASFTDVDSDGDADLLLLNDFGEWTGKGNRYFQNSYPDTKFKDVTEEKGFDNKIYGMGIGQGDYDSDADLDYYITNIGRNFLYQNNKGSFTDKATELKIDATFVRDSIRGTSWSGLFFDVDFDGDLDLYVSKGNVATLVPKTVIRDPNLFFLNEKGVFKDVSAGSGVNDVLSHRGSAVFDFDHDGDLDIISSVVKLPWAAFAKMEQKIKLYRNDTPIGNWIGIKLEGGEGIGSDCYGCQVVFQEKGASMMKEVDAGSGQASQSTAILYFGLGKDSDLDALIVHWGDQTSSRFSKLAAGKIYTVNKNGKLIPVKR
jgi:hypothetical protein